MSDKKPEPKELSDEYILAAIAKESKEFDKVRVSFPYSSLPSIPNLTDHPQDAEIDRILKAFRLDAYAVLDLQPGVPDNDIKKCYRMKSLLIHPDKTSNPSAPDAFDRLAKAHTALLDEKERAKLDECIADARMLLMRERKLTVDSEEVKDPDAEFRKAWREKTKMVLVDEELRRRKKMKAQMQEEGRAQKKEEEEIAERKRKREFESKWEQSREERIGSWRDFQKGKQPDKKKKKIKTLG
jgi:DnaJ family protein C protein 8